MGKYGLRFDTVESSRELRQLAGFLHKNPGTYRSEDHDRWIEEVCIPGVASGERSAVAWWQDGELVGDAVLKIAEDNTVELKNFRKRELFTSEGRSIHAAGGFMMRQIFDEAGDLLVLQNRLTKPEIIVRLDTTAGNPVISFFEHFGFRQIGQAELYTPGQTEILMAATIPYAN